MHLFKIYYLIICTFCFLIIRIFLGINFFTNFLQIKKEILDKIFRFSFRENRNSIYFILLKSSLNIFHVCIYN